MQNIFIHLFLVAFVQSSFFILLITIKEEKRIHDYLLILFIFLIGTECISTYLNSMYLFENQVIISVINITTWTLFGPVLYLYLGCLRKPIEKFNYSDLIHLLPYCFALIFSLDLFLKYPHEDIYTVFNKTNLATYNEVGRLLWSYTTLIYFLWIIVVIGKHKNDLKLFFSNSHQIDLNWIKFLTAYFAIFLLFELIALPLLDLEYYTVSRYVFYVFSVVILVFIFGIGYFGFRQKNIFYGKELNPDEYKKVILEANRTNQFGKYKSSNLDDSEIIVLKNKLLNIINNEKPYLNPEITLNELAGIMGISVHKLSQLLNTSYNQNFYDFINFYRIETAKDMLHNVKFEHFTILAIAYECGFNSKTTFYNAFKKIIGQTPTEYRNSIQNSTIAI